MKNYIFIADACNRIEMLAYRDEDWSLTLISKDYNQTLCRSLSVINDNQAVGLVVGDDEGNFEVLQFDPKFVLLYLY